MKDMLYTFYTKGPIMLCRVFPFLYSVIGLCECKWSSKANIPKRIYFTPLFTFVIL